mgnify:CR=1 FL=1|jgi:hypothetical protein
MKNMIKILLSLVLVAGITLVDAEAKSSKRSGGRKKSAAKSETATTEAAAPAAATAAAPAMDKAAEIAALKAKLDTLEKAYAEYKASLKAPAK